MTAPRVDDEALRRCADEPIAVPGAVQPHGVLLAVTEPALDVVVASANAAELFGQGFVEDALVSILVGPNLHVIVFDVDQEVYDILRSGLEGKLVDQSSEVEDVLGIILIARPSADDDSRSRSVLFAVLGLFADLLFLFLLLHSLPLLHSLLFLHLLSFLLLFSLPLFHLLFLSPLPLLLLRRRPRTSGHDPSSKFLFL